ncbi:MAG: hypothetical protein JO053_04360 [Acidobacteria bacterium]|nr:hypothetical protein [Acidobacteriota bacterium]
MNKLLMTAAVLLVFIGVFGTAANSQTRRVRFARGRTSQTISSVLPARGSLTFALFAKSDQVMTAAVTSPKTCVKFANAQTSFTGATGSGDNFVKIENTCRTRSPYTFVVSINY